MLKCDFLNLLHIFKIPLHQSISEGLLEYTYLVHYSPGILF